MLHLIFSRWKKIDKAFELISCSARRVFFARSFKDFFAYAAKAALLLQLNFGTEILARNGLVFFYFFMPILPLIRIPVKFKTNWIQACYKHSWLAKHCLNGNLVFIQTLQTFYFQQPFISKNYKRQLQPKKKKIPIFCCIFLFSMTATLSLTSVFQKAS